MALPLPRVVSDVGPGGGLVTAMGGMNALSNEMLNRQINSVKAQYAPLTTQADAASKMAYANLMGPQFLAKLMGNDSALANMSEDQKRTALQKLYQAGSGQGTGNYLTTPAGGGNALSVPPPQQNFSLTGYLSNKLKGLLDQGGQQGAAPQQAPANPLAPQAVPQPNEPTNVNAMNAPAPSTVPTTEKGMAINAWLKSPEARAQAEKEGMYTVPEEPQLMSWYRNQGAQSTPQAPAPQPTYAENTGTFKGVVKEGEKAGELRAEQIKDLNETVFNAETKQTTLDDVNNMISSPEIRQIRQLPLLGRHEMSWYAREGTPAQQQLVGRLYAQMGNIVKDSSRDFAGQFRRGEQQLLQGMKPTDADTVDTMIGKAESLTVMNKMLMQRARLTSQYMRQYHIDQLQATDMADKQVNGEAIRQSVHNKLNPKPTDEDINHMAKKYNVSTDEIKKRLKAKGII
jgi:hypothetical protein